MVIVRTQPGKFAALLERHALYQPAYLVVVRVEGQVVVPEVVYREGLAVLVLYLFVAHAAHHTHAPRVDAGKGTLLVVVDDAVLLHVHVHIPCAVRKHQPAVPVFLRVDVPRAAYREQPRVELRPVGRVAVQ